MRGSYGASAFLPLNDWRRQGYEYGLHVPRRLVVQPAARDWQVDNVTNMHCMFRSASSFNQPLGDWRVDNVTIWARCSTPRSFNQPLGRETLSPICTGGSATRRQHVHGDDMRCMFWEASSFNQPLGDWRLRAGCNTQNMFANTKFRNSRPVKGRAAPSREQCAPSIYTRRRRRNTA